MASGPNISNQQWLQRAQGATGATGPIDTPFGVTVRRTAEQISREEATGARIASAENAVTFSASITAE